ncbi:hypothetical protein [Halorubellus litoreus]|uniref:HPP family protein n=1 Tax=Halorubellus litoreus TaxID=755308 RepID=A0ABD5VBP9_9EURY
MVLLSPKSAAGFVGSLLVAVGSLLPWFRDPSAVASETIHGFANGAHIVFLLAIVALFLLFVSNDLLTHVVVSLFVGSTSLASASMTWIDIPDAHAAVGSGLKPGTGLLMVTLGALTLLGYALLAATAVREYGISDEDARADFPVEKSP